MIALNIIDARQPMIRRMAGEAMREALNTGLVEAAPSLPGLVAIVLIDGKPVCRLTGNGWALGDRRSQEIRPLTEAEKSLPASRVLSGYGTSCGGLAWTPAGFLKIGHELKLLTETEAIEAYNRLAVRDDSTPEFLEELCRRA